MREWQREKAAKNKLVNVNKKQRCNTSALGRVPYRQRCNRVASTDLRGAEVEDISAIEVNNSGIIKTRHTNVNQTITYDGAIEDYGSANITCLRSFFETLV